MLHGVLRTPTTRRIILRTGIGAAAGLALGGLGLVSRPAFAADSKNITPAEALQRLIDGNKRFASGQPLRPNQSEARRLEVAQGQLPFATIVSCVDSRVPPELVFDQGLGDLFVLRVAGNVINDEILGSIEFGIEEYQVPLVVVLGHERCGAVVATVDAVKANAKAPGHIGSLVEGIRPAAITAQQAEANRQLLGPTFSTPVDQVDIAVRVNAVNSANQVRNSEPIIHEEVLHGNVAVYAMRYDLETGMVELLA
jgi:carbonic anhydrase